MAALTPGAMGAPTPTSSTPSAFRDSLAADIENALIDLLADDGKDVFDVDGNEDEHRDRRRLFVAIAQGVIDHLEANIDAFRVEPDGSGGWKLELDVDR